MIAMTARAARRRLAEARRDDDAGFSLLEVIVSFVLFAIIASTATYGVVNALTASHTSQQRVDAANVAQWFIADTIHNTTLVKTESAQTFTACPSTTSNIATDCAGVLEQFSVRRTIRFNNDDATQCSAGATFTVDVVVSQLQTGTFLARSDSVIAC